MKLKFFIIAAIILMFFIIGCNGPRSICGDEVCNSNENKCSCATDCGGCSGSAPGACREYRCANGICTISALENCCGNGICEGNEIENCPTDCIEEEKEFGFGLEYIFTDAGASFYKSLGAKWARINYVNWSNIEPNEPVSGEHSYNFKYLDETVLAWQQNGYENLHIRIQSNADWAVDKSGCLDLYPGRSVSYPVLQGHEQNFYDYVYNMVERYDNDGIDDMPGLLYSVNYYELMSEAQHSFEFCVRPNIRLEEYENLLKTTYEASKAANPNAKIILSGITMEEVFAEYPEVHLECMTEKYPKQLKFIEESFKLTDYYDIIEFHALMGGPTESYGFIKWLREDMKVDKPVWVGDAFPIQVMTPKANACRPQPYPNGDKIFQSVDNVRMEKYGGTVEPIEIDREVEKWYLKEQASQLVKKVVITIDAGYDVIMLGNTLDWFPWRSSGNHLQDAGWMGLVEMNDVRLQLDRIDEMEVEFARPAFHAYKQLIQKIDGFDQGEKIDFGDEKIFLYKFVVDGKELFIAWYEDGINECPHHCESEEEGTTTIDLTMQLSKSIIDVKITPIVTELDSENNPIYPPSETVSKNSVPLTETPIFIKTG